METHAGYIIGAYAGSPAADEWDAAAEARYYDGLKSIALIRGLEHPFHGALHRDDDGWFLSAIDPRWDYVFTCIPGTMERVAANPAFGLASAIPDGRREAIAFHEQARRAVLQLNRHLGRLAVIAVQVHSAPRRRHSSDGTHAAFAQSLRELAERDWDGAALVVEHADALVPAHPPEKGFLTIGEEIQAIRSSGADVRVCVNWGRSVVEGRSAETPLRHIETLRAEGLLAGVIFSGTTNADGPYGPWLDRHVPPAPLPSRSGVLPAESLMTVEEIRRCLKAAGTISYTGAKVMLWPKGAVLEARLELVRETIEVLEAAREEADG
jgi:hypothetical protein